MVVRLKPITEVKPINYAKVDREIHRALQRVMVIGAGYFKRTTRSWSTVILFYIDGPADGKAAVGTDHRIYEYVTRGTRPHLIKPVRAKFLVFGEGKYVPKTNPGVLGSRTKGTGLVGKGGVARPIFTKVVHHPGTKARGFEGEVARKLEPVLINYITAAFLTATE